MIEQAIIEKAEGGSFAAQLARLEDDPNDEYAAVLARIGRHIEAEEKAGDT